jgi:hypothetical protein
VAREGGREAFYKSFLENFGGSYLISPIFYAKEKEKK